jgi:phosphoribosylanthranilate isomerase
MINDFIVKICGIKDERSAQAAFAHAPSVIGFIFIPHTPRFVDAETAKIIAERAHARGVQVAGVFQDQTIEEVKKVLNAVPLDYVQLHGREDAAYAKALGVSVIKTVSGDLDVDVARAYMKSFGKSVSLFLFDRTKQEPSTPVNLDTVKKLSSEFPILLAGGLDADNVERAIHYAGKGIRGVDVSRGVEKTIGEKDRGLIKSFIQGARNAYAKL